MITCITKLGSASGKSANPVKRLSLKIENPQSATVAEGPQIKQIIYVRKFVDLQYAEFNCGPPTFAYQ